MGFMEKLKQRRERIKKAQELNKQKREQRRQNYEKEWYAKYFNKNKQTVVVREFFSNKEALELCLEVAKEYGYKMIHKDSSILYGLIADVIFEKIAKPKPKTED